MLESRKKSCEAFRIIMRVFTTSITSSPQV